MIEETDKEKLYKKKKVKNLLFGTETKEERDEKNNKYKKDKLLEKMLSNK